jgi:hypothetical protein
MQVRMLEMDIVPFLAALIAIYASGIALGIILHEFGHAGIGWLAGFHPRLIRAGNGPTLLRVKLGSAWFELRLWPLSGGVICLPRGPGRLAVSVTYLLGGMLANALVLATMSVIWFMLGDPVFWALVIGMAQVELIARSVVPYAKKWRGTEQPSDTLKIWRLLRHPEADAISEGHAVHMRRILPAGMPAPSPSPDTPEIIYQVGRRDRLTDQWARRDASAVLQRVLARHRLPAAERAYVLDNLVRTGLLRRIDVPLERLEAWSLEAIALVESPYTLVTHGGVLLALGRPAEAEALLTPLLGAATVAGQGALCEAYIKQAAAMLRHEQAKHRLLAATAPAAPQTLDTSS